MNAQEARKITEAQKNKILAAQQVLSGDAERVVKENFDIRVNSLIESWKSQVARSAKKGDSFVNDAGFPFDDPKDKIYEAAKAIMESEGYHVSIYETDEGYCIGDVSHVYINW